MRWTSGDTPGKHEAQEEQVRPTEVPQSWQESFQGEGRERGSIWRPALALSLTYQSRLCPSDAGGGRKSDSYLSHQTGQPLALVPMPVSSSTPHAAAQAPACSEGPR